jgi:hypothetical protein
MTVIINGTTGVTSVNGSAAAPSVTGTDTDTGIVYGTNTLSLATGGTTALTIDSSQNITINGAPANGKFSVKNASDPAGTNGVSGVTVYRASNDSRITLGYASTADAFIVSTTYDTTGAFKPLAFATSDTVRMQVNVGSPVLCLSGGNTSAGGTGIAFPATQNASTDANTLDDYEEGTWTPIAGSLGGSITSYTSQGAYTKVGRIVTVSGIITLVNVGTANSQLTITGLPFSNASGPQIASTSREASFTGYIYYAYISATSMWMQNATNGGIAWTNGYSYHFNVTYQAA